MAFWGIFDAGTYFPVHINECCSFLIFDGCMCNGDSFNKYEWIVIAQEGITGGVKGYSSIIMISSVMLGACVGYSINKGASGVHLKGSS